MNKSADCNIALLIFFFAII